MKQTTVVKTTVTTTVNSGRVGVVLRGSKGTGVLCWPHANELKGQDGVHLFQIRPDCTKPCNVCSQLSK